MANTLKPLAKPAYLTAAVANIYTPPAATIYCVLRHIHVANVTAGAVSFTLYVGVTGGSAAGTELFKTVSVPAFGTYDYPCLKRMDSTDFLTGLASAATSLTITVDGEQGVV